MSEEEFRTIIVEGPSGEQFEARISCKTPVKKVAGDFYASQNWPEESRGRRQRAVVELVNPKKPDETKRLNGEDDICESGVEDGDTIRIFPESIAGAVDQRARTSALIADHNEIQDLADGNSRITFTANRSHAPDKYEITFNYTSFVELSPDRSRPLTGEEHRVEIVLGAEYPRKAPFITWKTAIFHPNIDPSDGEVCLGAIRERYLPGMGLARITRMLFEMIQWRNFDSFNPFNRDAAQWAVDPRNWETIKGIGGHPFQGPIGDLLKTLEQASGPRITFRPLAG